jgi:hypothetical protein
MEVKLLVVSFSVLLLGIQGQQKCPQRAVLSGFDASKVKEQISCLGFESEFV